MLTQMSLLPWKFLAKYFQKHNIVNRESVLGLPFFLIERKCYCVKKIKMDQLSALFVGFDIGSCNYCSELDSNFPHQKSSAFYCSHTVNISPLLTSWHPVIIKFLSYAKSTTVRSFLRLRQKQ